MSMIRLFAVAALCLLLAIGTVTPQPGMSDSVLAANPPRLGPGITLPSSSTDSDSAGKYPRITAQGNLVSIASNPNEKSRVWTKGDTAAVFANPTELGSNGGKTDYATASIATAPDGSLYAVWIVQSSKISFKHKPVNGSWSSTGTVRRSGSFVSGLDVTVSSSGQIFVTWNEDFAYRYVVSSDGGSSWSSSRKVSSAKPFRNMRLTSGPNNAIIATFGSDNGHVYAAIWNGTGFVTGDVTPFKSSKDFFAEPGAAIAPNGKMYVAWRNANGGVYYAERQPNGTWPNTKLANGAIFGTVGIAADANSNLHVFWSSNIAGRWDLWYAFKASGGDWQGPLRGPINASVVANTNGAATLGAQAYGHAVAEEFNGSDASLRYQQFASDANVYPAATPVLESGAASTKNNPITLSFANVVNNPDSVRFHWDAAPTDADPWTPFAATIPVAAPAGITADACQTHFLLVQMRSGALVNPTVPSASITFDIGIQAGVEVLNPYLLGVPAPTQASTSAPGASNGDPTYTRETFAFLSIRGHQDCSHLANYSVSGNTSDTAAHAISGDEVIGSVALTPGTVPNNSSIAVNVTDGLGNARTSPFTLTYDPSDTDPTAPGDNLKGLPVLRATGNPTVTAATDNTVLRPLTFKNISVTDNIYGQKEGLAAGRQFWGVYIANTTSPTVTVNDPSLTWVAVPVLTPTPTFSVTWDLFSGLGYQSDFGAHPGDYYIFVRFLDGAGNASTGFIKQKVALAPGYSFPITNMPIISK